MADKYADFASLARGERPGIDFRILVQRAASGIAVIAPHGGAIEPGTSEIATAIAAADHSLYSFEGLKTRGNRDLHITSTRFDEPMCLALLAGVDTVLTIHGEHSGAEGVYIGGRDTALGGRIGAALKAAGFVAGAPAGAHLQGADRANICNRGKSGAGVQLELSRGVRESMFATLTQAGRARPSATLARFAAAVRAGLA